VSGSHISESFAEEKTMASAAQSIQLNPVSPENLLDPVPLYSELRANAPVLWSDMLRAWFITRHDDVMNCFRDARLTGDRRKLFDLQLGTSLASSGRACPTRWA
jgi:cytochrome P450